MGTQWQVQLPAIADAPVAALETGILQRLERVIAQMSTWDENSELCRFNRAAPGSWHSLSAEFFTVLDYGVFLARQTGGAYNPAAGELVDLWGFGPAGARSQIPDAGLLHSARASAQWRDLQLDRVQRKVLQTGDVRLDLSSIAKGFAVDLLAEFLLEHGVQHFLVEIGGEFRGHGVKPDRTPWWVAIEAVPDLMQTNAGANTGAAGDLVALCGLAIATSGDYRQFFEHDGRRYSHTLDTRTGYPVANSLASVTVLHRQCMVADALATALTVLGPEHGLAYAQQHQIAAQFICRSEQGLQEHLSAAMAALLD